MSQVWVNDQEVLDQLRKPFPPELIGKLPRTAKRPELDFVGHAAVTDRLNESAPGWFYTVDEMFTHDGACWIRGTMTIGNISRVEFGDGDDPKEALGNFIRRAAMRWGVALDLWLREKASPVPHADKAGHPDIRTGAGDPSSAHKAERSEGGGSTGEDRGMGNAVSEPEGEPPSGATFDRVAEWAGGRVKGVNAVNRTCHTAYTGDTILDAAPEELEVTLAALMEGS